MARRRRERRPVTLLANVEDAAALYHEAVAAEAEAREVLYAAIRAAVAEGIPAARVARHAGLSRERVRQIASD